MLRKGKITSIDEAGSGIITDENEQEIPFTLKLHEPANIIGANVSFDIQLKPEGLVATDILLITSSD